MDNTIFNSSMFKNIEKINKQFDSITKVLNNNGLNEFFIKQQEISQKLNIAFSPIIKQQMELSNIIKQNDFLINLHTIDNSILENMKTIQKLFNNSNFLELGNVYKQLKENLSIDKNFIENLNNFSKELQVNYNLDFDIKYEDIEEINKKIEQKKAFTKKDLLKVIRFLEILLLFYSIYSEVNPDNSEHIKTRQMMDIEKQQIIDKISQSEIKTQQMIKELNNKVSKSLNQEKYYEVIKNADVREQPNRKSKKIAGVYSKQKLLVIENKLYWLQVEYFDEKRNETIIGWVSKKCTKRLD